MRTEMRAVNRLLFVGWLLLVPSSSLFAQTKVDPSGHWAGAIHVPPFNGAASREVAIEIDLAINAAGELAGTFGQPGEPVKGLPLANVALDGRTVSFELKATAGGGVFRGTIADTGTISGEFVTTEGGYNIPFDLKRTGDAQIAPAPRSAPIGRELEGTWTATLEVNGKPERLVLKMANQADGTAAGTILDLDGSTVEIPIAITQAAANVTIDVAVVGASYAAVLNANNELVGTWTQGSVTLPLTFKRGTK
jgi:hypothetical protein